MTIKTVAKISPIRWKYQQEKNGFSRIQPLNKIQRRIKRAFEFSSGKFIDADRALMIDFEIVILQDGTHFYSLLFQ